MESSCGISNGLICQYSFGCWLTPYAREALETIALNSYEFIQSSIDGQSSSYENFISENEFNYTNTWKLDSQEYQPNHISSCNEVTFTINFKIKDELLQGNGLCWVSDLDIEGAKERVKGFLGI